MIDKIFSGADVARLRGLGSYRNLIITMARQRSLPYNGQITQQDPVQARIDFGRWLADCECGGAEYVDPDDQVFFCQSCGNTAQGGRLRRVIFPWADERETIEAAVLKREVQTIQGIDEVSQALRAKAVDGISRSWVPGESVEDLRDQLALARAARKIGLEVKRGL